MPIYAYRCATCGHAKDVLQKVSDPVLTTCPACGEQTFEKQVTAAGFQLKGSGWYVTDFRGDNAARKADKADADGAAAGKGDQGEKGEKGGKGEQPAASDAAASGKSSESPAATPAPAPAAAAPAASATAPATAKPGTPPAGKG